MPEGCMGAGETIMYRFVRVDQMDKVNATGQSARKLGFAIG